MRHSKATRALLAVLILAMSVPVLARGRSGGSHAGRSHSFSGTHSGVSHHRPDRFFGPRVGVVVGAPLLYAPFLYPPPASYYPLPPPVYMQQMPGEENWYFCPGANAYYPYVEECPGGWQQVAPQPQG